jgi:YVTN family beta-propeller protein
MRTITTLAATLACCAGSAASAQTLVVLNKAEASVTLLNPLTGEADATIPVGAGPHEAATSPDGRTVVVCNYGVRGAPGNTLSVIDLPRREVVRTIDLGEHTRPHGILYMRDGRRVAVTTEGSRRLCIVNVETGAIEQAIDTDQAVSHMVALSSDESRAFVANIGGDSVSVLDLENARLERVIETGDEAEGVFTHPSRPEVWVTNRAANTISILDARSLELLATLECGRVPIRVAITPDGAHALVSNADSGDVAVFDTGTRREIARISMQATAVDQQERDRRLFGDQFGDSPVPVGILIQPDGLRAYVANTNADVVTVLDLADWSIETRLVAGQEPDGMAWSPLPRR